LSLRATNNFVVRLRAVLWILTAAAGRGGDLADSSTVAAKAIHLTAPRRFTEDDYAWVRRRPYAICTRDSILAAQRSADITNKQSE